MDPNLESVDKLGNSLLITSIIKGQSENVQHLLNKGADISHKNNRGDTCLHRLFTCHTKFRDIGSYHDMINAILSKSEAGCWKILNSNGEHSLIYCVRQGDVRTIKFVIEKLIENFNNTQVFELLRTETNKRMNMLQFAVIQENIEAAEYLARLSLANEQVFDVNCLDSDGNGLIHLLMQKYTNAFDYSLTEKIEKLINLGCSVNNANRRGDSLLHLKCSSVDLLKLLLKCGANFSALNNENCTPLEVHIKFDNACLVSFLIEYAYENGLKINFAKLKNTKSQKLNNFLHLLVEAQSSILRRVLKENNLEDALCQSNSEGLCPIKFAISQMFVGCLTDIFQIIENKSLIKNRKLIEFSQNSVNYEGLTLLHIAARLNNPEAIEILVKELKFDPNLKSVNLHEFAEGDYPIHTAAAAGAEDSIEMLFKLGADINAQDSLLGYTALHFSVSNNQIACMNKLLSLNARTDLKTAKGLSFEEFKKLYKK